MENLTEIQVTELKRQANEIRKSILMSLTAAGSGHTAGPLGMADVFTCVYFHNLKHDPKNPTWPERDRVVLSNGHICPVLYATMAHAGYFPTTELQTLRKFGSRLQGHPHREFLPFVETSSGPLGSGLSQAVGMAIAERINSGTNWQKFFYCFMGDGELNEGNIWEAVMHAGKEKLGNIIGFVDRNNIQIDGNTEEVMPLEPHADKWRAFNWNVIEVDGHNFEAINDAINQAKTISTKPTVIIAHTIPSKGVKAWEHDYKWHGKPPTKDQLEVALKELDATI